MAKELITWEWAVSELAADILAGLQARKLSRREQYDYADEMYTVGLIHGKVRDALRDQVISAPEVSKPEPPPVAPKQTVSKPKADVSKPAAPKVMPWDRKRR